MRNFPLKLPLIVGLFMALAIAISIGRQSIITADHELISPKAVNQEAKADGASNEDETFNEDGLNKFTERYVNHVYRFSVEIPHGLVGYGAPDGAPAHGVAIVLSKNPKALIYVAAHYNALDLKSPNEAVDQQLEWVEERGSDMEVTRREQVFLQNLPATRFAVRYKSKKTGKLKVEDRVTALRQNGKDVGIIYELMLDSTEDRYNEDIVIYEQILKGWKMKRAKRL